jgi:GMP synthase-like glutamine amidotransferase
MRYHVLQHVSFETPGILADEIHRRGHLLRTTALYNHELLPDLAEFDVLIVMGGPMSIHDEAEFGWLVAEKELIRAAITAGKKVLGICLGAQLIAAVSGARVYQSVNQAFSLGDRVLGIQFHPEVTGDIIRGMVEHEGWELAEAGSAPYVQSADQILAGERERGRHGIEWLFEWL